MAIVAGVDFGTLSVRVSLVDSERGLIGSALSEYPLHRKREDPDFATQSHNDHMRALAAATKDRSKNNTPEPAPFRLLGDRTHRRFRDQLGVILHA